MKGKWEYRIGTVSDKDHWGEIKPRLRALMYVYYHEIDVLLSVCS